MHHRSAFTVMDMLAAMSLLAIVLVHTIVGCSDGSARRPARAMMQSNHVRGIHSGLVLYSQGNKDWFPGLDASGFKATVSVAADAVERTYGFAIADGTLTAYRFAVLLRGNFFSPEYMRSPSETNEEITTPVPGENFADGGAYSFAMLNISDVKTPRAKEWRATNNSRAVVISDRNIGSQATGKGAQSIHSAEGEGWRGSVCYNDNRAILDRTDVYKTEYAGQGEVAADQLFSDQEKTEGNVPNADAAMVFKAGDAYVNQQP